MCSRQQPSEGADSPQGDDKPGEWTRFTDEPNENAERVMAALDRGEDPRPPLTDLPVANRSMVEQYVRQHMPNATPQEIQSQVSEVVMADSLGRAIHQARRIGGPWMTPCVRPKQWDREPKSDEDFEQVPYGYDSGEFECMCESMALHLVELMKAQAAMTGTVQNHIIVAPSAGNGRLS